ncbi:MAG: D-alanyl-D-alanine carboxypeptidase [Gammaproteobacteria bacterium]|nr:MAG: D-alanyl-D-alanine carboxypeptidase [Gammaproteobacteria bacterium]TDJ41853.1 MAG: D-alanyl-D-alanine carboxypeptidase [Gammaproteobacteria bacterium]
MDEQLMPLRIFLCGLLLLSSVAAAQNIIPEPPAIDATGYLLIDADTERVLAGQEMDATLPPASLTKIMTSFVAAAELAAGRISITDDVPISVAAWRTPGSRMFVREGTTVTLGELLKGIVVQSGNDASVAVAEYIAGTETAFAEMMNQQAQALGMYASHFQNATGLPDEGHYTSVRDLATLTRALIRRYPEHYASYAERSFTFNDIEQPNRNRLLWRDRTVDGVKTGYTKEAGYCLVASALRDGMRLITVVMGTTSDEARMRETQKLLKYGFRYFQTQKLYDANVMLKQSEVWYGAVDTVKLGVTDLVYVTIPRGRYDDLKAETDIARVIEAPLEPGQELGALRVTLDDEVVFEAPLVALEAVAAAGFFKRLWHALYLFFSGLFR